MNSQIQEHTPLIIIYYALSKSDGHFSQFLLRDIQYRLNTDGMIFK